METLTELEAVNVQFVDGGYIVSTGEDAHPFFNVYDAWTYASQQAEKLDKDIVMDEMAMRVLQKAWENDDLDQIESIEEF